MIQRLLAIVVGTAISSLAVAAPQLTVNAHNFARAESDRYFARLADHGAFGKLTHARQPVSVDRQDVIRMNRDTLYSDGVFDLDAGPVTVILPDAGKRYMAMQIVSEDHYTADVTYASGVHTYTRENVGTRYAAVIIRTLANPEDPEDMAAAHRVQDAIQVRQEKSGTFEIPQWDSTSRDRVRAALTTLGEAGGMTDMFGKRQTVDPIDHVIGAAVGWGGNPRSEAIYNSVQPERNNGKTVYRLTVHDVPVDGFWSISVYDRSGHFAKNEEGRYSLNNLTAKKDTDGAVTVQFGGCQQSQPNCLPVTPGWNYTVRMYRPRAELLSGAWTFPQANPVP
jgi:para-nitrobenzyl esterase